MKLEASEVVSDSTAKGFVLKIALQKVTINQSFEPFEQFREHHQ
ncbi:unnamed protein product [Mycena citricolor]|uniref:Uncharacterized protein n=1 Tax=Mycena citricolor TaxID=2018698 RepID=A0AAD2Q3X6_9AGAR|nr:unnamed protein product [Mycena citricolor]CAK5273401.1 unnamed protein product [Mycena citricolor]CAK5273402.1 unnamed protein product [Mycena citricolor]